MDSGLPLVPATTVFDSFHGRVILARLFAEEIPANMRGASDGPYPIRAEITIFVRTHDEARAREILFGDEVDATFAGHQVDNRRQTWRGRRFKQKEKR